MVRSLSPVVYYPTISAADPRYGGKCRQHQVRKVNVSAQVVRVGSTSGSKGVSGCASSNDCRLMTGVQGSTFCRCVAVKIDLQNICDLVLCNMVVKRWAGMTCGNFEQLTRPTSKM